MSCILKNALIITSTIEPGALDLAARIGLEAESLTFPVTIDDNHSLPSERFPIFIGKNNRLIPQGVKLPKLLEGEGALLTLDDNRGIIIWGEGLTGQTNACRWAASIWSGSLPEKTIKITEKDLTTSAVIPGAYQTVSHHADWPRKEEWECLSQTYTVNGLMGSINGLCPDNTKINFKYNCNLSLKSFALLCDVAARIGLESNGLTFPLVDNDGKIIEICSEGDPGWIKLGKNRLVINSGEGLNLALQYLAREFPDLPGKPEWLTWDITAFRDILEHQKPPESKIVLQKDWQIENERERFIKLWKQNIVPSLLRKSNILSSISIDLRISEPEAERSSLSKIIKESLDHNDLEYDKIIIKPAFKQAFFWLVDEVLPQIKPCKPDTIIIYYQLMNEKNIADLPIRWLQEIYPADEVICKATGAETKIIEESAENAAPLTVKAYRGGKLIWEEEFKPSFAQRPLLDGYEKSGYVNHPTGSITISDKKKGIIISKRIYTDLELFWNWYSKDILTEIESKISCDEPLFGTLSVKYCGSEPETRTGIREEVISPLEALHQDIYFTSLDRFAALGKRIRGKPFTAPGAIIPQIINQPGCQAKAQVTLTEPVIRKKKNIPVTGIKPVSRFEIMSNSNLFYWVPPTITPGEKLDYTGKPLHPEAVEHLLSRINKPDKSVKIRITVKGRSIEGRAIYAIELFHCPGDRTSPTRASLIRPTLMLNGRHHGNEVSSTTAIFDLINKVLRRTNLLKKVNLVTIPMENVDGSALHHKLAQNNPNWKLHAARFNRDGYDFYNDYFNPETTFSEAKALPRLWQAWLPDLILDAHGVPSHEWVQYFSGFNSPSRFPVSYWLPSTLFYGILFEPEINKNIELGTLLGEKVALSMMKDTEIESANKSRLDSYKTYGHNLCPEAFPLAYINNLVFFRHNSNKGMTFAERHPMITITQLITEVADETATGSYLELCARAHLKSQLAALLWLCKLPQQISKNLAAIDNKHLFIHFRRVRAQEL